jgi:hypothetical protein
VPNLPCPDVIIDGERLTVEHDVTGAPATASMVRGDGESQGAGGGHDWILSDLESLLETGSILAG